MRRPAAALIAAAALVIVPPAAGVSGPLPVLVMPITWTSEPETTAALQSVTAGAATFIGNASYGQVTVVPTMTPWLHPHGAAPLCTDLRAIHDAATSLLVAMGYDANRFSRRIYLVPYEEATCHTGGP